MKNIDPSLWVVLATIMINMMGVGMMWPIMPTLVGELTGGTISNTAAIYGATAVIFSVMQFLFAPLMGALSDRFGRRPVMLVTLFGLGVDTLLIALAPSMLWVFIARALGGVFGATYSIASAYIADTMKPEERAAGFGFLGAAFGIGFIIGPIVGGLFGAVDIRLPFLFAGILALANVVFGWFFLKETNPPENRTTTSFLRANPFGTLGLMMSSRVLMLLGAVLLLVNVAQRGMETLWVIFAQHQYGWDIKMAGLSLSIVGISYFVVQGFLVRPTVQVLGEAKTAVIGIALCATMFLLLSFNTVPLIAFLGIPLYALGAGCAVPALQAIASKNVDPRQQGHLQGTLTAIAGLSAVAGPALSSGSFSYFTSQAAPVNFPGAYFLIGCLILATGAALSTGLNTKPAKAKAGRSDTIA